MNPTRIVASRSQTEAEAWLGGQTSAASHPRRRRARII